MRSSVTILTVNNPCYNKSVDNARMRYLDLSCRECGGMSKSEMATAASWTSDVLCRYYMHGACRKGNSCEYSHDLGKKPSQLCQYYQKGSCTYGDRCRFDHVKTKPGHNERENLSKSEPSRPARSQPIKPRNDSVGAPKSRMVTLKKQGQAVDSLGEGSLSSPPVQNPDQWVKAAEFVPGQLWKGSMPSSYLEAVQTGVDAPVAQDPDQLPPLPSGPVNELCPYAAHGECRFADDCPYIHGNICDMCGKEVLHPDDPEQQEKHIKECMKWHEEDMELSFAVAFSKDKSCGICMETIVEKNPPSERRFGILSNCNHVYCLSCIRKWRSAKQFENKIVRACPECRVKSDFITPSKHWVEDAEQKQKLIDGYKHALSAKPCKYFDQGRGECPFNAHCFYLHAYPDGRKASPKPIRRRRRQNADGDLDLVHRLLLWDFFEERERTRRTSFPLDIDEDFLDDILLLWDIANDSDDSDDDFAELSEHFYAEMLS